MVSKTLTKIEENYATNEKEKLAIIWALQNFYRYLYGVAVLKIFTDHQPLTYAFIIILAETPEHQVRPRTYSKRKPEQI